MRLLTGGLLVRVQPEEPISSFTPLREHVERLNVSGRKTLLTDEAVGDNVKLVNNGEQIRVRVSMSGMSSSVPSTPPHFIKYEFRVKGTLNGNALDSDPKSSGDMTALWRMPDGFDRYGQAVLDVGGDDWASKGAYK